MAMGKFVPVDQLEQVLKCPVCLEVPSPGDEGRMLLCINGHSICQACYTAMEERTSVRVVDTTLEDQSVRLVFAFGEKVCPVSRCDYDDPPRRNRLAEELIELTAAAEPNPPPALTPIVGARHKLGGRSKGRDFAD